ncbi:hypothetical protein BD309DRAFT_35282 [Dichomitus squalens]|uniref:Uncharacterized protein n=2 Tax=Dichomitus squalens TaxID=114155 RepID=A0A4Q9PDE4_9APHY|nr:uncharacterized protein DICSQDRAFT_156729 [Dichomitus squalens LYAD-421 SS1]EJF58539.1 hypothetical protein DICSQDRAFT_156729 [Dichomitus squalens LYAD-421 SS1]TBU25686.1 hypothetical protein BD311DRAFT_492393 [Dichomitus squalens]TBU36159.1 hypothetical protein BD309DRAFT_35282 [Dichomitus squalens]TBU51052.1 hypothetical protein BD310DRAFT_433836 [Dichomitus squalens]
MMAHDLQDSRQCPIARSTSSSARLPSTRDIHLPRANAPRSHRPLHPPPSTANTLRCISPPPRRRPPHRPTSHLHHTTFAILLCAVSSALLALNSPPSSRPPIWRTTCGTHVSKKYVHRLTRFPLPHTRAPRSRTSSHPSPPTSTPRRASSDTGLGKAEGICIRGVGVTPAVPMAEGATRTSTAGGRDTNDRRGIPSPSPFLSPPRPSTACTDHRPPLLASTRKVRRRRTLPGPAAAKRVRVARRPPPGSASARFCDARDHPSVASPDPCRPRRAAVGRYVM